MKIIQFLLLLFFCVSTLFSRCTFTQKVIVQDSVEITVGERSPIEEYIRENIDIIVSDYSDDLGYFNDIELINTHTSEVSNIISMGDIAIPYLDDIVKEFRGSGDNARNLYGQCVIAEAIKYRIKPEAYDYVSTSPDGKYSIKGTDCSFVQMFNHGLFYHKIQLIDNETNYIIVESDSDYISILNFEDVWSPDNRYAAVHMWWRRHSEVHVIDTQKVEYIILPMENEIKAAMKIEDDCVYDIWRSYYQEPEWISNDTLKVYFWWMYDGWNTDNEPSRYYYGDIRGWYVYDLNTKQIIDFKYNIDIREPTG